MFGAIETFILGYWRRRKRNIIVYFLIKHCGGELLLFYID